MDPSPIAQTGSARLKIGQVAERVGLSLRTVRYYEEVGLLTPAGRTTGGFRLYDEQAVERLIFLKGMKPLGLPLEEIRELVNMLAHVDEAELLDAAARERTRKLLAAYVERARARISQLEAHIEEVERVQEHVSKRIDRLDEHVGAD